MAHLTELQREGFCLSEQGRTLALDGGRQQLLDADLRHCGRRALPDGVSDAKQAVLAGPVVLQVDPPAPCRTPHR